MRGFRQIIVQQRREIVPRIEVAVPVLALNEESVLGSCSAISRDVIERMRPGVCKLPCEVMPLTDFQDGLQ